MGDVPSFEARNVTVDYGGAAILSGLSLSLPAAGFTILLGPNGSGKSTLLKSFARLLPVRGGDIRHKGTALRQLSSRALARQVAVLAQGPTAPEGLSVRDLVEQGRYPHRSLFTGWSQADEAACGDALGLTGMQDLAARPLEALSGGQRQRAWIAMTLAQQTETLLLDEPTTFLDIAHQIDVLNLVRRLVDQQGKTVIAVLHDINQAARYGDYLVMLKDGQVRAAGAPEDVVTPGNLSDIFGLDARVVPDPESGTPMCIPKYHGGVRRGRD